MKNLKDVSQDTFSGSKESDCIRIKKRIYRKTDHLSNLRKKIDDMQDSSEFDIKELHSLSELFKFTQKEISRLEAEQQKLGCNKVNDFEISYDHQTVISTSSVRRKDSKSLQKLQKTNCD